MTPTAELPPATGWPPGLLQDDPAGRPVKGNTASTLSKWFASRADARWALRQALAGHWKLPPGAAFADEHGRFYDEQGELLP